MPFLVRPPCLIEEPRLEAFLALRRLLPWPEDTRLLVRRRLLPPFECVLVVSKEELDQARWRLSRRFFIVPQLSADRVAELARLRCLRERPSWRRLDELHDLPRLTFLLTRRRFGTSLAVSVALLSGELLERFLRLTLALSGCWSGRSYWLTAFRQWAPMHPLSSAISAPPWSRRAWALAAA